MATAPVGREHLSPSQQHPWAAAPLWPAPESVTWLRNLPGRCKDLVGQPQDLVVVSGPMKASPRAARAHSWRGREGHRVPDQTCTSPNASRSSPQDSRLYLVFPHDSSALCSSFHHLQLFDQDSSNVVSVSPHSRPGRRGEAGGCPGGCGGKGQSCDPPSALSPALPPGPLLHHLQQLLSCDQLLPGRSAATPGGGHLRPSSGP